MSLKRPVGDPIPGSPAASRIVVRLGIGQEETVWCWAACVEMVKTAIDETLPQCQVAEIAFGPSCCSGETRCRVPLPPARILELWHHPKVGHPDVVFQGPGPLSQDDLENALKAGPVQVWLGNIELLEEGQLGGSGHVLLVTEPTVDGQGKRCYKILDSNPGNPKSEVTHSGLAQGALMYDSWVGSWTGIKRPEGDSHAL